MALTFKYEGKEIASFLTLSFSNYLYTHLTSSNTLTTSSFLTIYAKNVEGEEKVEIIKNEDDYIPFLSFGKKSVSRLLIKQYIREKFVRWVKKQQQSSTTIIPLTFTYFLYPSKKFLEGVVVGDEFKINPKTLLSCSSTLPQLLQPLYNTLYNTNTAELEKRKNVFLQIISSYPYKWRVIFKTILSWVVASSLKIFLREKGFTFSPLFILVGGVGKGKSFLANLLTNTIFSLPSKSWGEVFRRGSLMKMKSIPNTTLPLLLDEVSDLKELGGLLELLKESVTNGYIQTEKGYLHKSYTITRWSSLLITANSFKIEDYSLYSRSVIVEWDEDIDLSPYFKQKYIDGLNNNAPYFGAWLIRKVEGMKKKELEKLWEEVNEVDYGVADIREKQKRMFIKFGEKVLNKLSILPTVKAKYTIKTIDESEVSEDYVITTSTKLKQLTLTKLHSIERNARFADTNSFSNKLFTLRYIIQSLPKLSDEVVSYYATYGVRFGRSRGGKIKIILTKSFFEDEKVRSLNIPTKLQQLSTYLNSKFGLFRVLKSGENTTTTYGIDITKLLFEEGEKKLEEEEIPTTFTIFKHNLFK